MITREWLDCEIEKLDREVVILEKRFDAAVVAKNKADREYAEARESLENINGCLQGLLNERESLKSHAETSEIGRGKGLPREGK